MKAKSTFDLSNNIKQIVLPALLAIDIHLKEAGKIQEDLENDLERIQADHQLLITMIETPMLDFDQELVNTDILKKRLLNLQRKIIKLK